MKPRTVEDIYPLSPLQEGILYHNLFAPETGVYLLQNACVLRNLDVPRFVSAWEKVMARHAILRTAFVWKNLERPLQVVGRLVGLPLVQQDWCGLSPVEQAQRLETFLENDRRRSFELTRGPLMRISLFRLTPESHELVWTYNHLLLDGWSKHIVVNEVFAFYRAALQGRELTMKPAPAFRDYIAWLQRQDLAEAEVYWRETLRGFKVPTRLRRTDPGSRDAPSQRESIDQERRRLPLDASATLQAFVRSHQLTLNTLVQGAWALLLARRSGDKDVVFGTTVSGRPPDLPGAESMVGVFINTLPLRVQIPADTRLLAWLQNLQVRQTTMSCHEHSPLVQVHGWSEVPRRLPLFESLFVFENYAVDRSAWRGDGDEDGTRSPLEVRTVFLHDYPLTLIAAPGPEMLLELMYDRQRFSRGEVLQMLDEIGDLLQRMTTDPELEVDDLLLPVPDAPAGVGSGVAQRQDAREEFQF